MKNLKSTIKFENKIHEDLKKEYSQYLIDKENKNDLNQSNINAITTLPKIRGSISNSFIKYLSPYVDTEEKGLKKLINDELDKEFRLKEIYDKNNEDFDILQSSVFMFKAIDKIINRTFNISRTQILIDIHEAIKRNLDFYLDKIKNFINKEEETLKKENNEEIFLLNITVLINTIDYIKDTISDLTNKISSNLEQQYLDKLDFYNQEDGCIKIIHLLIKNIEKLLENKLNKLFNSNFQKIQWDKLERIDQHSSYVDEIIIINLDIVKIIQNKINNVFLTQILKSVCDIVNKKFFENILKIKKLNDISIQQLQLDFTELKQAIINLGLKPNGETISNFYITFVEKNLVKNKLALNLLSLNNDKFLTEVKEFKESFSKFEIEKIMLLKNFKKTDIFNIINN